MMCRVLHFGTDTLLDLQDFFPLVLHGPHSYLCTQISTPDPFVAHSVT